MSERPLAAAISGRGIVAPDEAAVACDDEGFARGRAAFETLRVYDGVPFRLDRHVERLVQSAARLGLPAPDSGPHQLPTGGGVRVVHQRCGIQQTLPLG